MDYIKKALFITLIFFITSETSLNAGWKDFFTMPRVILGIAMIGAGSCIGHIFSHIRKQAQDINRLKEQIQKLKTDAGEELQILPPDGDNVITLSQALNLMATKNELIEKIQRLKNHAGEELQICIPFTRETGTLNHILSLMATQEELQRSFNFFTLTMKQNKQQIQAIHNDLSQEMEQSPSTTQWPNDTDDNEEPVTVIIKTGPFKKALKDLEKLATNLDPQDSLRQHAQSIDTATLQY